MNAIIITLHIINTSQPLVVFYENVKYLCFAFLSFRQPNLYKNAKEYYLSSKIPM